MLQVNITQQQLTNNKQPIIQFQPTRINIFSKTTTAQLPQTMKKKPKRLQKIKFNNNTNPSIQQNNNITKINKQQQQIQKQSKQQINTFQCKICKQQIPQQQKIILQKCYHQFCQACMLSLTKQSILTYKILKCPNQNCQQSIDIQVTIPIHKLQQNIKKIYKRYKIYYNTLGNDNVIVCPNQQCDDGVLYFTQQMDNQVKQIVNSKIDMKTSNNQVICKKCGYRYCSRCLMPVHVEYQCKKWDVQMRQIQDNNNFRHCIKCNKIVQLIQGCNHIVCKCGCQFCYKCNKKWRRYHTCNPFTYRPKTKSNTNQTINSTINSINPHNSKIQPNNTIQQQPQCKDYTYYICNYMMKIGWSFFSIIFFIIPMWSIAFIAILCMCIGLCLVGISYGYGLVICSEMEKSKQQNKCCRIFVTLIVPIGMGWGVIAIFKKYGHKIVMFCRNVLKISDYYLPLQIIPECLLHQ